MTKSRVTLTLELSDDELNKLKQLGVLEQRQEAPSNQYTLSPSCRDSVSYITSKILKTYLNNQAVGSIDSVHEIAVMMALSHDVLQGLQSLSYQSTKLPKTAQDISPAFHSTISDLTPQKAPSVSPVSPEGERLNVNQSQIHNTTVSDNEAGFVDDDQQPNDLLLEEGDEIEIDPDVIYVPQL